MLLNLIKSFILLNANASPRSFFPGRSFFFWLLIGIGLYICYLYRVNKNKKDFFKSGYIQSISLALSLLFLSFIFINTFFDNPRKEIKQISIEPNERKLPEIVSQDKELFDSLESNFTETNLHYRFIQNHFEIPEYRKDENGDYVTRNDFTVLNFYLDKMEYGDSVYRNNARLALGMFYFKKDSLQRALSYLNLVSQKNFPLAEAFKGKIFMKLEDTLSAIAHYKIASDVNDILQDDNKYELIDLLYATSRNEELFALLQLDRYKDYFSPTLASKLFFLNNKFLEYYSVILKLSFRDFKWTGFVAAFGILLVWLFYMVRLDVFEKESYVLLALTLLAGMIFSVLCFYLYDCLHYIFNFSKQSNLFLYCIFGIGVVEEFVKIIPLLLILLFTKKVINEPYDYILYAAISALGFSFMENILYFDGNLSEIIHGRGLTSVPGHIIDSSIVAYGLVLAKYRYKSLPSIVGFLIFFLLGAINHGLYDFWLYANVTILFITNFLISVSLWVIIINNCINNSPSFQYLVESDSNKTQMILSFSLMSILVLEYVMVAWENGPDFANDSFNSHLVIAGVIITYYSSILTNMDLVKGYWATVPFKTINDKKSGAQFDLKNFILRLLSGDIFSYSFVHLNVSLQAHYQNEQLRQHFYTIARGKITDRVIVTCIPSDGKEYEDPYWFRVDTQNSINIGGGMEQTFLFRFEENRPSFDNSEELIVYLFALKNREDLRGKLKRENLRSLGRAVIKKN